jgi:hypothetical protein
MGDKVKPRHGNRPKSERHLRVEDLFRMDEDLSQFVNVHRKQRRSNERRNCPTGRSSRSERWQDDLEN